MFRRFKDELGPSNGDDAGVVVALVPRGGRQPSAPDKTPRDSSRGASWLQLKTKLHERLLEMLNLSAIDKVPVGDLRREVSGMVSEILAELGETLNVKDFAQIVDEVLDEVLGLGPLEPLLKDPTVNDILVNTHEHVFVERRGKLELTSVRFKDEQHLFRIIDKIVSAVGRRVDESQPWVDARLPDGSRVNAIIPPCAIDGSLLSIRKFAKVPLTMERLIENEALTREMAELLKGIIQARLNVVISGGTGSGKTTMLNAVSRFIGDSERVITIEDAAELQLQQQHVARMETRPPNIEGRGAVTQRDLVRNALRMRPDRIILGEIRGAEALDMLQAMNTGHDGSMTTIHANNCREAVGRLEQMLLMTGLDFPMRLIRAQIASSVNVVVQVERMGDGKRRLVSIYEITGMEGEVVSMQEIFRFRRTGTDSRGKVLGQFEATGIRPRFAERLSAYGIHLPAELFATGRALD
jgi:pilus assembly protein CpaF